jgi:hypothetical protein
MKKIILPALLISSMALSGCVISIDDDGYESDYYSGHKSWQKIEKENREHIAALVLGTKTQSVIDKMGVADFNEALKKGDEQYQVLWYRTQRRDGDGVTTKDECTPLVFKNNELVGWGETALERI